MSILDTTRTFTTHAGRRIIIGAALALIVVLIVPLTPLGATHLPADKVAVGGSAVEIIGANTTETVLGARFRTATPSDLIIQLSLECSLITDVTTTATDDSASPGAGTPSEASAQARLKVWVEIGGERVPVSADDKPPTSTVDEVGKVVFCDRLYKRKATLHVVSDSTTAVTSTVETFFSTRSTHGFNWAALNLGTASGYPSLGKNNVFEVLVKVQFLTDTSASGTSPTAANAVAVLGHRTLVLEPVKLPRDAKICPSSAAC